MSGEYQVELTRRRLLSSGLWLGAGAGLAGLPLGAALARYPALPWTNVTALIDSYVSQRKLAGAVAAMGRWHQPARIIARGSHALDKSARIGADSLFRIYSMTKPITGMAAMILIDEGRLGLDQPIADLLPKFAKQQVQVTPDGSVTELVPATRAITVRHLLTHTAGLGYSIIQQGPIKTAYERAGVVPGQVSRTQVRGLPDVPTAPSLAEFADRLAQLPLVYEPGTQWSYSVSLDLLGRVIELASGQSFESFLHQRLFGPCGMTSTFFQVPVRAAARLTDNYGVGKAGLVPLDPARNSVYLDRPAFPFGGAGLVSSPRDYDRFLLMLLGKGVLGGKRVMTERAVALGTSNLLPEGVVTAGTMVAGAGFGAGGRVGLGNGAGQYGWGGAAGTVAMVDSVRGVRAAFYTQYMPSDAYPLHADFPKAVAADLIALGAG
ncbi:serine hydrolase [Novosphingobium sp.]|uniref:serine hydrolase domain-containing protein n=1 Tax=Novosphingobium sp. TaxID=1874826 RepID=UPI002732A494|nr:serine hydrolase domain-containing protein [Novosphingobium sp.]MDP3908169.1 serine hydrolase domain-containing protein [Novosphingobium sp.]